MRQVVLDTETTGLETGQGHRIIEVGCIELIHRRFTGGRYHRYINPERSVDAAAVEVHGITDEFLADKPRFADIVDDLLAFLDGAELIIHNAPFDVGFINHELSLVDTVYGRIDERCRVMDTLELARRLHPGQKNSLDALCRRYQIDNSQRTLHGALLDAEILADVYLAMTGGQAALSLEVIEARADVAARTSRPDGGSRPPLRVLRASDEEQAAHRQRLVSLDTASSEGALWRRLGWDE